MSNFFPITVTVALQRGVLLHPGGTAQRHRVPGGGPGREQVRGYAALLLVICNSRPIDKALLFPCRTVQVWLEPLLRARHLPDSRRGGGGARAGRVQGPAARPC